MVAHMIEHELRFLQHHPRSRLAIIPRWLTHIPSDKTAPKIKRFGVNVLGVDVDMD
ncbi:MAG: hypothetical protein ACLTCP_13645 [Ruminococcus bicirculans (ex Wegman et al. 2014)]